MFPVAINIADEDALIEKMTAMREWLDHRRFEPSTFRYTFVLSGILFQVDFASQTQAAAFASEFGGRAIAAPDETLPQAAGSSVAAD